MRPDPVTTTRTIAPAPAERLLIASFRDWAFAREAGRSPHDAMPAGLAAHAGSAAAACFFALVRALEAISLRPLEVACRHCGGASTDLQRLVVACGVAPVNPRLGEQLLAPLVSDPRFVVRLGRGLNLALT
ncbi:hypothetical protein LJR219_001872 [Phenylobacterium sp. LjRoot219]|uniref:hypothetical protein n=1 Tax=Phenylobacterium sp. LjRoot219 TaxID=3342283 RepID=UPI003ECFA129